MTAREIVESLIEESGYQFRACLKDLTEENAVTKPIPQMMSIRDCVEHCMEAYEATITGVSGGKHSWGTYRAPEGSFAQLVEAFDQQRTAAVEAAMSVFDSDAHYVKDYIILHDTYHVGQMAAVRHALGDGWDSYSIYRH